MSGSDRRKAVGGNRGRSIRLVTGQGTAEATARQDRLRMGDTRSVQQRLTDATRGEALERVRCPECGKAVMVMERDGRRVYRGHQAQRYLPCVAGGRDL